jgi:hypothetical protein
MRVLSLSVLALALLLPALGGADEFQLRVFQPRDPGDPDIENYPYLDWLTDTPSPYNFYYGYIDRSRGNPLDDIFTLALGVDNSTPSAYDTTGTRSGLLSPAFVWTQPFEQDPRRFLAWFLMSSESTPQTCGYGGSLGCADLDGTGGCDDRGAGAGDGCAMVGRGNQPGQCAPEWTGAKEDQNPHSAWYQSMLLMERDFRCQVILLNLSAHW